MLIYADKEFSSEQHQDYKTIKCILLMRRPLVLLIENKG
jgi:hypothetical protein